ncbi:MAG: hypothetical protein US50_C0025G0010 [Candidatus Nomurabacteria bacterium GW2011_GWB1_37_5]|uniref:Uncharacterized protein n=1 Tax=Candidatus Nomurabacteria bacterium GW2011_GWB1_37_5 TaxID=1618742 RepID=A0A0G0K3C6_9BACT|nr:MAG: hypothetical protein US50_C0025G0010 [Candidatus Nomurabacteria bacterium GW2011_GWB1_37_5]
MEAITEFISNLEFIHYVFIFLALFLSVIAIIAISSVKSCQKCDRLTINTDDQGVPLCTNCGGGEYEEEEEEEEEIERTCANEDCGSYLEPSEKQKLGFLIFECPDCGGIWIEKEKTEEEKENEEEDDDDDSLFPQIFNFI